MQQQCSNDKAKTWEDSEYQIRTTIKITKYKHPNLHLNLHIYIYIYLFSYIYFFTFFSQEHEGGQVSLLYLALDPRTEGVNPRVEGALDFFLEHLWSISGKLHLFDCGLQASLEPRSGAMEIDELRKHVMHYMQGVMHALCRHVPNNPAQGWIRGSPPEHGGLEAGFGAGPPNRGVWRLDSGLAPRTGGS